MYLGPTYLTKTVNDNSNNGVYLYYGLESICSPVVTRMWASWTILSFSFLLVMIAFRPAVGVAGHEEPTWRYERVDTG